MQSGTVRQVLSPLWFRQSCDSPNGCPNVPDPKDCVTPASSIDLQESARPSSVSHQATWEV